MKGLTDWWKLFADLERSRSPRRRRTRTAHSQIERLESRCLLTLTLPAGSVVAAGQDYFAIEQNKPLDYSEPASLTAGVDDREAAGLDDTGITNVTLANGHYNFTTGVAPQIFWLFPGASDNELQASNRAAGAVPEETTGETIPIDSSKYYMLNMKITVDGTFNPIFYQGNIQWYDGRATPTDTATRPFFLFPGTNIYSFNLKTITLAQNASGGWTGNISGLRLFPLNTSGVTMHIDWVTLTGESQSPLQTTITGAVGNAGIGLSTDGTNLIKFIRPSDNSDGAFLVQTNLVSPTNPASISQVDLSMLGAGTYYLHQLDALGNILGGVTAQQITVNAIPQIQVLQPDNRGDESRDLATAVRGDAWDFSQTTDFSIPQFVVSQSPAVLDPVGYGSATIVSNPVTTNGGTLSGNWMKYTNTSATRAPADTNFLLSLPGSVNSSVYKNLTIRVLLDRTRDVGAGSVLRVAWSDQPGISDLTHLTQSDDIIVQNGVQELHIDLSKVKIEPHSTGNLAWGNLAAIQYLRIDPSEYPASYPVSQYFDQILLTPNDRTVNGQFTITWNATDANGDALTLSSIKLDPDKNRSNGNEILVASPGVTDPGSYTLNTAGLSLTAGSYYVLLTFTDGKNSISRYSTGVLDVTPLGPSGTVPMLRSYNPNAFFHFFTTDIGQFDNAVRAGYRDESTGQPSFSILTSQVSSALPLYRLYNKRDGFHYYTLDANEKNSLVNAVPPGVIDPTTGREVGWRYEGIEGYMYSSGNPQPGTAMLYRLYNIVTGVHLFTPNPAIRDYILNTFPTWKRHADVGYAFPTGAPGIPVQSAIAEAIAMATMGENPSAGAGDADTSSGPQTTDVVTTSQPLSADSASPGSSANLAVSTLLLVTPTISGPPNPGADVETDDVTLADSSPSPEVALNADSDDCAADLAFASLDSELLEALD